MATEIERKFLVKDNSFRELSISSSKIVQGYLSDNPDATVRVRIMDTKAFLTVKSRNIEATRGEWEFEIPLKDATEILDLCSSKIIKNRYIVPFAGFRWEVDVFEGNNKGLVIAEIELPGEHTHFDLPPFIGKEVTGDTEYYNSVLSKKIIT